MHSLRFKTLQCYKIKNMWNFNIESNWDRVKVLLESKKFINQSVFGSFTLLNAWLEAYKPLRELQVIIVQGEADDGAECIFPLCIWKRNWKSGYIRSLIPIGYSDYDYNEPLFTIELSDISAFWSDLFVYLRTALKGKYDKIQIPSIRNAYYPKSADWEQGECCPQLKIASMSTEEDLSKFLKTSLRGDIRRQIRRLQELGDFSFHTYKNMEEVESTFDAFMKAHINRWPNAYKAPGFHRTLLQQGLGKEVHFSSLNVNGFPIAWHLGFKYNGVYYYYMPCGDPEYLKFSPVKVHLFMLIVEAIKNGCKVYDHLRGEENYKQGWSDSTDYVWMYEECSSSVSSKLRLFLGDYIKTKLK